MENKKNILFGSLNTNDKKNVSNIFRLFNENMARFLEDLQKLFPDDKDYPSYLTRLNFVTKINFKKPTLLFYTEIANGYEQLIIDRDESFLLNHNFDDHIEDDQDLQLVMKLKKQWKSISKDNKDTIWNYFLVLFQLSKKCYESEVLRNAL